LLGELCPRCLIADGLEKEQPPTGESTRFSQPFFIRTFGDYELLQEVARGGMGVIYKARQRSLGRIVAIKTLSLGEFASPEYVRRFRVEAAAAARLQHPNIVAIHEVGQHEGVRYFSMDFVEGPNLAQLLGGQALPAERAAGYLKTLAETVHYAHQQGILHRDLKPSNILIDPFGEPRVTDFGLAKEMSSDSDLTITGQVLGTPGYLPPEQADTTQGPLTPAADVYSLGAILYYMLTARAPFVSGSLRETLRQVLNDETVAPSLLNPNVPKDLETICLKCLEREPSRRYQTAAALAEDARRFLAHEPILARPLSPLERLTRWCRRRPALAAVWLLALTLTVGSTLSAIWISRAWSVAKAALAQTKAAEAAGRDRLRDAKLAEARAVRGTKNAGRRAQALAALAEAAQIRPGPDLRDEALAAMVQPDLEVQEKWDLNPGGPAWITYDPAGSIAAVEHDDGTGMKHNPATLFRWGNLTPVSRMAIESTNQVIGHPRFSNDGKLVMARYLDESLRVWRVGEDNPFLVMTNRPLPGAPSLTPDFNDDYDFSPDGKMFVLGLGSNGLTLNRVEDGAEVSRWEGGRKFSTLRFAPDGTHVAATLITRWHELTVVIFTAPELTRQTNVITLTAEPESLAWSSDGRILGVSEATGTVALYDVLWRRLVRNMVYLSSGNNDLKFLGGDSLLGLRDTGSRLRLLSTALGVEELVLNGISGTELVARPGSDFFLTTSAEGVATRWKVEPAVGFRALAEPCPDGFDRNINVCGFDFSPEGHWVVSAHGRYTLLRDTASGRAVFDLDTGDEDPMEMATVAFTDEGQHVLRSSSRTGLQQYSVRLDTSGQPQLTEPRTLDAEPGFVMTDHASNGQRFALVDLTRGRVKLVEVVEGKERILSRWEDPDAWNGVFSPDGTTLLLNYSGTGTNASAEHVRLFRVSDGTMIKELPGTPSCDAAWTRDGKRAMTSNGMKQSILWNTANWQPIFTLDGKLGGNATTFVLSPDGLYSVIDRDSIIYFVSLLDGTVQARFEVPGASGPAVGIRFLPDGRRFAVLWPNGRIDLFDPEAMRQELKKFGLDWQ